MMAQVVPILKVVPLGSAETTFIRKMKSVLSKQGQIEPPQVHKFEGHYLVWPADPWGNEIVYAARELGWTTLLIVETSRYTQ